jgi:hypothetical protein
MSLAKGVRPDGRRRVRQETAEGRISFYVIDNLGMEKRPRRFSLPEAFFEGSRTDGREDCSEHAKTILSRDKTLMLSGISAGDTLSESIFICINPPCPLKQLRGNQEGVFGEAGVPQRREKRFGNGVKNLSGSADIPKLSNIFITRKEMLTRPSAELTMKGLLY